MINIGIVGSRRWTNKKKIEKAVDLLIMKYNAENICIISGGAVGADTLGKEVALEKKLKYKEYNPAHTIYNKYSAKPKDWFGKQYFVGNYFERNTFIAESVSFLLAFIPLGATSNGTMDTVSKAKKLNKAYKIIN